MPSSLIVVGLVVAWLVVLVPMVVRKRADARNSMEEEYDAMPGAEFDDEYEEFADQVDDYEEEHAHRPYRPGRGGFDPETAAIVAQAKYAFRRRVVGALLLAALVTGVVAGVLYPLVWWGHAALDLALVGYLVYLRRQVRIEEDIRARRLARLAQARRRPAARPAVEQEGAEDEDTGLAPQPRFQHHVRPGTVVVDADDEDPVFVELDGPEALPYRRASGE
ncbi:gephyrin-like molybdotransferase receptor GlpR [Actinosynnema sp. NPDC050436]|uniref:divisome protein SepX/GlpR n=1 Tax=Actinosynnema sp. NPDC050436 TaxID=3155659 RepID=UPI0033D3C3B7